MEKEKYLKGFNHAYLLKQYEAQLIEIILTTKSDNDYIQGLKDGKYIYEQQKTKSRFQELENSKKRKTRNLDRGLER